MLSSDWVETVTSQPSATVHIEIPFHDVDSYRVVWHGNYARYFEIARCKLLDALQVNYSAMEKMGYLFPVVDLQTKFVRPLVFGQCVRVTATMLSWQYKLEIRYRIVDATSGALLTRAKTSQVAITPDGVLQFPMPRAFVETIESLV
jgi:acyl-CoA thioester hydrolase